jgi:hypothetical protein
VTGSDLTAAGPWQPLPGRPGPGLSGPHWQADSARAAEPQRPPGPWHYLKGAAPGPAGRRAVTDRGSDATCRTQPGRRSGPAGPPPAPTSAGSQQQPAHPGRPPSPGWDTGQATVTGAGPAAAAGARPHRLSGPVAAASGHDSRAAERSPQAPRPPGRARHRLAAWRRRRPSRWRRRSRS